MIQMQNVVRCYKMGTVEVYALKHISLCINEGEYTSIMGPSGSGKSTLMNIIGCLDKPTRGEYLFNGIPVAELNDDQLAEVRNQSIGFVFQTFNLLTTETALQNVELPMIYAGIKPDLRSEIARKALEDVKLSHRMYHRPSEMSGGERQRVAIARALVNDPPIILADEPTGNLDSKTGAEIMSIFKELSLKGKTIILVTHDPQVALYAQRIIHIKDGLIENDEKVA
ncbi:MAG: ABC transporter ATP-binding protein [Fibrobacter sp.]|nr:ABC transporter ATP-binding protein [Fibrobacter sp.]